jgi:hypothetical protein
MKRCFVVFFAVCLMLITFNQAGHAQIWGEKEYAMLEPEYMAYTDYMPFGPEYTQLGAPFKGNETGEIPDYEGAGHLKCPEGYNPGDYLPDAYAHEEALFRIDHTNYEKYKDRLTPGQIARLKKNKFFYMSVYPTHRDYQFPKAYILATEKNTKTAYLDEDNVLRGYNGGLPFPFPKNGLEFIWNVKKPWAGNDLLTNDCRRVVSPNGKIRKSVYKVKIMAFDETRVYKPVSNPDGVALKVISFYLYPADKYGEATLWISYTDDTRKEDIWQYIPSLRRVRRAPTLGEGYQGEGECCQDESGFGYKGPINNFTWTLLGKKELYVAEHTWDMWKLNAKDEEECLPGDINPAILRYELHRCWVVEGVAVQGLNHPYSKRVYYFDEDNTAPHTSENYDRRGNLWRMAQYYQMNDYCMHHRIIMGHYYLNLESGRYEVNGGCRLPGTKTNATDIGLKAEEFTVQVLRGMGR